MRRTRGTRHRRLEKDRRSEKKRKKEKREGKKSGKKWTKYEDWNYYTTSTVTNNRVRHTNIYTSTPQRENVINPSRAVVPIWGQTTEILNGLSPKWDCCSKKVKAEWRVNIAVPQVHQETKKNNSCDLEDFVYKVTFTRRAWYFSSELPILQRHRAGYTPPYMRRTQGTRHWKPEKSKRATTKKGNY